MHPRLWQCPTCRRKFAKQKQWHSCRPVSIEVHFTNKPAEVRRLFDALLAKLRSFGHFRVDAVPSSVNLVAKHHFGGVRVLGDGLRIGFIPSHAIDSPRMRVARITSTSYGHSVKVTRKEDVDRELIGWLREAHTRSS